MASTSSTASASTATPTAFVHRWAARAFYAAFQRLSGTTLPEGAGDFRLLDRKAVDAMNRMRERVRFNKGLYRLDGLPLDRRAVRCTAAPGRRRLALAAAPAAALRLDGIASFTTIPLRVWSYLGLVISLFAFVLRARLPGQDAVCSAPTCRASRP